MTKTLCLRLVLRQIALLLSVALIAFLLVKAAPVDPIDAYLGPAMGSVGPAQRAAIAEAWGLDRALSVQFLGWLGGVVRGDLGQSHSFNAPVADVIAARIAPSLALAGGAWLLSAGLGYALGIVAGLGAGRRRGLWRAADRGVTFYAYLVSATPGFWFALVMLSVFAVQLGWAPFCCAAPLGQPREAVTWITRLHHLALPLATLTLLGIGPVALHSRQKSLEIYHSDPVLLARAHGAGPWHILHHFIARGAALPALVVSLASAGEVVSGAILAEQVFAWPGLGQAVITAGMQADVALLLALTLVLALVVAFANLLADVLARQIDPRQGAGGW